MRPLLAWIIICHWTVLFGLLAAISALDPGRGPLAAFELLGASVTQPDVQSLNPWVTAVAAWAVASTALLFLWALLSVAFANRGLLEDGVVTVAFASGGGLLSVGLLAGFLLPLEGYVTPLLLHLLVLLASYLAIAVPVRDMRRDAVPGGPESRMAARLAAIGSGPSSNLAQTKEFG